MKPQHRKVFILFLAMLVCMVSQAIGDDVTVASGTTYNGNITTDTGDITVFPGARVKGNVASTSGDIYIEDGARVKKIISLNGDVFLKTNVTVDQTITLTYGSLFVDDNCVLKGDVENEYGDIRISGSQLNKKIITRHGDVILQNNTYVKKDIEILDRGNTSGLQPLDIYLGTGVVVDGDIEADDEDDLVELTMFGGEVDGDIDNVTVTGDDQDEEEEEDDEDDCGGRPLWSSSVNYNKNDQVQYEGGVYKAKKKSKNKNPASKKSHWTYLGSCDDLEEDDD